MCSPGYRLAVFFQLAVFLSLPTGCDRREQYDPLPADAVVLAFGDSVTAGVGADPGEDYPARLAERTGLRVINGGVSGDTARAARGRLQPLLEQHRPDLVIVELGGNDFLRQTPPARVRDYLREILDQVRASGVPVALVAVPRLSLLRAGIGRLADSPIYAELAALDGVVLVPDIFSAVLSDEALRADEIHPNARGYATLSEGIHAALFEVGLLAGSY